MRFCLHAGVPLLAFLLPIFCLQAEPPQRNSVTAIRYWTLGDVTRVVVETTSGFEYHSDRAINPDRLFFDVLGATMRLGKRGQHTIPVGDPRLKQIRVAETLPSVTRIVFDLQGVADFSASQLTNPDRLIVELRSSAKSTSEKPVLSETGTTPVSRAIEIATATARPTTAAPVAKVPPASPPRAANGPTSTKSSSPVGVPAALSMRVRPLPAIAAPKPATLGNGSLTRVLGLKIGRVVLDAGHGGHDTGTIGPGGLMEKELVLDICKRLGELIQSKMGSEVVYTRPDDTFVPLETRTEIANQNKADLFLSIHANSSPEAVSSGVETYYLNFTNSRDAMAVAARENASSQRTVYDLKDLLQKIALQDKIDESREFAARVQRSLHAASVRSNSRSRDRGVKKAPFVVLIGASMPSVLVEIGFVSNPNDEKLFQKSEIRQRIAEGIYKGLAQYANTLSASQLAQN